MTGNDRGAESQASPSANHHRLAGRLNRFPLGAPPDDRLLAILAELFSPEEAGVLARMPEGAVSLSSLAEQLDQPRAELAPLLDSLADRGLIYARTTRRDSYYSALPIFPGIFELQFMGGARGPAKTRLAGLFEDYYVSGMGRSFIEAGSAYSRVLTVERRIPASMEIFPFERVSSLVFEASDFALATCYCRHEKSLLGQACEAPREVCMLFGPFARFAVEKGFAQKVDRMRMSAALEMSEEAGLIHVSDNVTDRINFLCNCCGCCCGFLRTITELGRMGAVAAARFTAVLDENRCVECLTCVGICQVKALSVIPGRGGIELDVSRCLGCGACVNHCPSGALNLVPRTDWNEPHPDRRSLDREILAHRGRSAN